MREKKRKMYARARAVENSFEWGVSSNDNDQIGVLVNVLDGELAGSQATWYGTFTEASEDRTIESLRFMGWNGTDVVNLPGLGSTDFQLTFEEEQTDSGSVYWKPAFVNRIGVAMKTPMDDRRKAAFAARLRAKIGTAGTRPAQAANGGRGPAGRGAAGGFDSPPPTDDDLNF